MATIQETKTTLEADAYRLSEALGELVRVVGFRDRDRACCYGLSVTQCYALKGVADATSLTVNDLASYLYLDKSTASRVANGLEDKGLLTRARDPDDGRVVRLVPTAAGWATWRQIDDDLAGEYVELLRAFDPDVRAAILELVGRLGGSFASRVDTTGGSCCVLPK
ncbi:MAG: MarR family transcriptional regulator [Gemmatimonadota bacterium]|nr:MarR family transcriptional regulator [Gemmatimonadota bacterium]MDH3423805.1 MarR family transcriptional regulator [Gemmatimonadota bacterium]